MPHANTHKPPRAARCPVCRKPAVAAYAPFCSQGCRDRDLLKWLGEGYRIPGPPGDPESDDIPLDKTDD